MNELRYPIITLQRGSIRLVLPTELPLGEERQRQFQVKQTESRTPGQDSSIETIDQ
ncbi:MAG: hypothetical protein AAF268_09370 [Cyanobacteria bacterium P01_A01_bin.3]